MRLNRPGIKLFLEKPVSGDIRDLIPVFHSWIQKQAIADHLLVDVHDYSHVPKGPGILLYGHEGSFSLDLGQDRVGLFYQRTRTFHGSHNKQLAATLRPLLQGCRLLESQQLAEGFIQFRTNEFRFTVHDRLNAPNTEETFRRFQPILSSFMEQTLDGNSFSMDHRSDPREPFAIDVSVDSSLGTGELLARLENDTIN